MTVSTPHPPTNEVHDGTVDGPRSTSSPLTRVLGSLALAGSVSIAVMGLIVTPPDVVQQDSVRIIYIHVASAIWMYMAVFTCAFSSAMWLRKRSDGWDTLAATGAELGVLLTALTLITGSIWGRPTWGVYWVWDARLTSTAMLMVLLLGYQALRRYPIDATSRSRLSAVLGLLLVPNVMIVHYAVDWWRSLHQDATISKLDPSIQDDMQFTLMASLPVMGLIFAWLAVHRFRVGWLERQVEDHHLDAALAERAADSDASAGVIVGGVR